MKRKYISSKIKSKVTNRAKGLCEYCKANSKIASYSFSIEHILPIAKGGTNELNNLAYSCLGCNNSKYTKTTAIDPISKKEVVLFNPRKNKWEEHFEWSPDFLTVIGITPVGRATRCFKNKSRRFTESKGNAISIR